MLRLIPISIFLFLLIGLKASAQKDNKQKMLEKAEVYIEEGNYEHAFQIYDELSISNPKDDFYKYHKAICAIYLPHRKSETINVFEEIHKKHPKDIEVVYYLGRAYHTNYQFEKAISYFDQFLANKDISKELKFEAEHYRANSVNGIEAMKNVQNINLKKLGSPLNTDEHEYVPVISTDESVLIFTYKGVRSTGGLMDDGFNPDPNGDYYEDIFVTKKTGDSTFEEPKSIGENINTKHHDASIALSPDGQELYTFYSEPEDGGDIFICHLEGDNWSKPERLNANINSSEWEGSCSITADGRYLYFASERKGGYGGRDIYVSTRQINGDWGPAQNLGSSINTPYNEDAPFIHPDGITLFFSSEGHNSIGGYDIMYSYKKDGKWLPPMNKGYPLNTTDDDRYYVINAKGDRGYFSSNRSSTGGQGHSDIYVVSPGVFGEKPVLAMVKGIVFGDGKPIEAKIEITKKSTGENIGPFHSNTISGHYLIALSPGENYTFHVLADDYPEHKEDLDIATLDKFVEIDKDFHLMKEGVTDTMVTMDLNTILIAELDSIKKIAENDPEPIVTKLDTIKKTDPCAQFKSIDFGKLKNQSLNNPTVYKQLMEIAKAICVKGMKFKVQVAAYRNPNNYNWKHLQSIEKPEPQKYPDGITRFTIGQFESIIEAETLRQKAISLGQKDAWIVGFIDGKRYTLEELIMVDFYNKNISAFTNSLQLINDYLAISQ